MTTFVFCCRKLIVHIHVFRRSTMKVPAFSNFLISLKSLIYPENLILSENPTKNILSCSTIVMKNITSVTSAVFSLTAQTTTLKLTFRRKISKKVLLKKTSMNRSLGRLCFWMQTWFLLPCRCIPEMSQRNHISARSYRK